MRRTLGKRFAEFEREDEPGEVEDVLVALLLEVADARPIEESLYDLVEGVFRLSGSKSLFRRGESGQPKVATSSLKQKYETHLSPEDRHRVLDELIRASG